MPLVKRYADRRPLSHPCKKNRVSLLCSTQSLDNERGSWPVLHASSKARCAPRAQRQPASGLRLRSLTRSRAVCQSAPQPFGGLQKCRTSLLPFFDQLRQPVPTSLSDTVSGRPSPTEFLATQRIGPLLPGENRTHGANRQSGCYGDRPQARFTFAQPQDRLLLLDASGTWPAARARPDHSIVGADGPVPLPDQVLVVFEKSEVFFPKLGLRRVEPPGAVFSLLHVENLDPLVDRLIDILDMLAHAVGQLLRFIALDG